MAAESSRPSIDGEDITTGFNPTFLLDGLTAIDAPVAQLPFTQASKPACSAGAGDSTAEADDGFRTC